MTVNRYDRSVRIGTTGNRAFNLRLRLIMPQLFAMPFPPALDAPLEAYPEDLHHHGIVALREANVRLACLVRLRKERAEEVANGP